MQENNESETVLFIDDEPGILKALERELKGERFKCFFAENAKQALQILEEDEIAVVVTDLLMPGIGGLELLEKIRKLYPLTVRVILSSITDIKKVLEAQRNGQTHRYLTKPWRTEEDLLPMLYQSIELHRLLVEKENLWKKVVEQNEELKTANNELKAYRDLDSQTRQRTSRHFSEFITRNKAFLEEFSSLENNDDRPGGSQMTALKKEAKELLSALNVLKVFIAVDSDSK